MSVTNDAIAGWNGCWNGVSDAISTLTDDLATLTTTVGGWRSYNATTATSLTVEYGTTPPVIVSDNGTVSIIRWPNGPCVLVTPTNQIASALAETLAPVFATLNQPVISAALTELANAYTPLAGTLPNPID